MIELTLLTHGWTFGLTLIGVIIIVAALTFFPALCLGPIVEHGLMRFSRPVKSRIVIDNFFTLLGLLLIHASPD